MKNKRLMTNGTNAYGLVRALYTRPMVGVSSLYMARTRKPLTATTRQKKSWKIEG